MTDENLKTEIKNVVENLANLEFTTEDELEFCKSILEKRKFALEAIKEIAKNTLYDDKIIFLENMKTILDIATDAL